ncbi:MAG: AsmA family protein [Candidatus Krumholzibacteria bacterium]|nr:AsmA family protein [Candidatus Krumholzibacteria bacterium]MDH4335925.1 AsmA family protein [Candidatus Krumholzibacteria bacterium]MDH5268499.1 AsmA family protein [Candidatus Krumholzibacteria bacterium]
MKKKILVSLGVVLGVVVIAVVVLVANLGRIVNSKKDVLLAQAEKQIGRDVSVGDVGVALWPEIGVRVRDVTVSEDPDYGTEPFVRVADLRVNVALMPLLKKRVDIKRFVLNDPVINVIKGEGNRFNFTSMVEAAGGGAAGAGGTGASGSSAAAVPFVLAVADIENGVVRYVDPAQAMDRTIRDIDFSAQNVSLDSKITATLAAAVFGETQDVRIEAVIGPLGAGANPADLADKPLGATVSMGPVKLSTLAAQKPGAKPLDPAQDGTLTVDATLSGTFGAAVFDEVSLEMMVLGATEPNVEITSTAGPFNLLAESTLVFSGARVKGDLKTAPISLASLPMKPTAPGKPAPKLGGEITATAAFEGEATALAFTSRVDATQATYEVEGAFAKPAGIPAVFEAQGTFHPEGTPNEGVEFTSIDATVHALKARGSGTLVPFKGREAMRFSFDATTAIAPWKDLMPSLAPFAPSGDATVKLVVSGAPKPGVEPGITGTATFANVSATLPNVPNPLKDGKGSASFTAKSARVEDATFTIGKSAFRAKADIPSFEPMAATYSVVSKEVWRADVQAAAPNAPQLPRPEVFRDVTVTGKSTEIPGAAKPAPGAPKPLQNDLEIASKSGIASNIDYTDATASVRATTEKVIIDRFSAKAMAGTISGSGTMEPLTATFDVTSKVENVNLAEYFRFKSPALADAVAGRISADFNISGSGRTWEDIQKTLAGSGGAVVIEGALLNVNVVKQLFASIQGMPMVPADLTAKMAARNPKLFASNTTVFKNLAGKVTIADGKLQVPDLKIASADFALNGTGWFGLNKDMNMSGTFTLSDALTRDLLAQVPMARYLLTPGGKLDVPLTFSGAVMKPNVAVDMTALTARAQQSLVDEGKQNLNSEVKGLLDKLKKKD